MLLHVHVHYADDNVVRIKPVQIKHIWSSLLRVAFLLWSIKKCSYDFIVHPLYILLSNNLLFR